MAKGDKSNVLPMERGRPSGGRPSYVAEGEHSEPRESKPGTSSKGPLLKRSTPREPDWRQWFGGRASEKALRDRAREEWRRVVPELEAAGLLSVVDRSMIADYCVTVTQIQAWQKKITQEGAVQAGSRDGSLAKHPLTTPLNQARGHARALAKELMIGARPRLAAGFTGGGAATPAGSSPTPEPDQDDDVDEPFD